MKININLQALFDIINLKNKIFILLQVLWKEMVSTENFIFKSKFFFPIPISFSTNQKKSMNLNIRKLEYSIKINLYTINTN